jgi:hypothetical protein
VRGSGSGKNSRLPRHEPNAPTNPASLQNQPNNFAMSRYVDGFVIPFPKDKFDQHREIAEQTCKVWMEHGALEYRECIEN